MIAKSAMPFILATLIRVTLLIACISAPGSAREIQAQTYPSKPIRIVVAYPPGGPNDLSARTLGHRLAESLSQPVVIENRTGAGGIIGSQFVATSPPDGYTLLNGAGAMTITPALNKNVPYNVARDFAPISLTAISSFVLAVHPSVPANSVKSLLPLAQARPGQLKYASAGVGTPPHLAGELLKTMTGVNILHVPYKGVGQSITDLIAGHIDMMFTSLPAAMPHVSTGKLKALAVSTRMRSPLLPAIPTVHESGVKGFEMQTWFGLLAPAGTPADIVNRLNTAVVTIVAMPDLRERLSSQGMDPQSSTPGEFSARIHSELAKFADLVRAARIQPE
jgi:tripartite-type tricarboxylate transporter receptor subunit TctC